MRTSCPAPGAARTCNVIILYQSEDQQELLATGDDLSYSIWALWGYEVVSGKSSSLVEKRNFRHFSKLSRPKVRFKDTQQVILFQHRSNRNCSQPPSAQIKNPCYQANNVNRPSTTNKGEERKPHTHLSVNNHSFTPQHNSSNTAIDFHSGEWRPLRFRVSHSGRNSPFLSNFDLNVCIFLLGKAEDFSWIRAQSKNNVLTHV